MPVCSPLSAPVRRLTCGIVLLASLGVLSCRRESPPPAPVATPAAPPEAPAQLAAEPTAAQLAAPATAVAAPAAATPVQVDRGPWADPDWLGIYDAPAALDRVHQRLKAEAPWLGAGVWSRQRAARSPLQVTAGTPFRIEHAGLPLALAGGQCTVRLPVIAGASGLPDHTLCTDDQAGQAQLAVWLWLLANGPSDSWPVEVETFKLAPERKEADIVLVAPTLQLRARVVLAGGANWLRLELPESTHALQWSKSGAQVTAPERAPIRWLEAGAKPADTRGWLRLPIAMADLGQSLKLIREAAAAKGAEIDDLLHYEVERKDGKLVVRAVAARIDLPADAPTTPQAPAEQPPLAIALLGRDSGLQAVEQVLTEDGCYLLSPRGKVASTADTEAVVVRRCGP